MPLYILVFLNQNLLVNYISLIIQYIILYNILIIIITGNFPETCNDNL